MSAPFFIGVIWFLLFVLLFVRLRRRRLKHIGSAAAGTVYDMLNEDKRKAVQIVVEGRAEEQDPENRDGNLPDLEHPKGRR